MADTHMVVLKQIADYRFETEFGAGLPKLTSDEPSPIGSGLGPEPVQLLLAAVGSCMSSSFHFAMTKFHELSGNITTTATATIDRDENRHPRVQAIDIAIHFPAEAGTISHLQRILDQFEQFCTVAASIGRGIPIHVSVIDGTATVVKS
jgi:uncharacterized OsmC-like protein